MVPVLPLVVAQRQLVEEATVDCTRRAAELLGIELPVLPVLFDLSGAAVGMFCAQGRRRWFRYNPWIFAQAFEINLLDTVPHEVAHYGVHMGYQRRGVKPHGPQWQRLVVALGGKPKATFEADLSAMPRRQQRQYAYRCDCRQHALSATRHNRVVRTGAIYRCRFCDGNLRVGAE